MAQPPKATTEEIAEGLGDDDGGAQWQEQISVAEAMQPSGEILDAEAQAERDIENIDALEGLRQMRDAIGIRWRIYRVDADDSRKIGFLGEWNTSQLSQKRIANKFGSGKYRIMGTYSSGKFAAQRTIEIAEGVDRDEVSVSAPQSPINMQDFFTQMDMREERRQRLADEREEKARARRMELFAVMGPLLAPALAALVTGITGSKGPDLAGLITALKPAPQPSWIEQMQMLKELTGKVERGETSMDQALNILERVREMAPKGEGERGLLDTIMEGLKAFAPTIEKALDARAQAAASGAPATPALTAPAPVPLDMSAAQPVPPTLALPEGHPMMKLIPWLPWFKGQLEMLLVKAASGRDPALRADAFIDDLPDDFPILDLMPILKAPDWFQQLSVLDSRIVQYQPWFTEFHKVLVAQLDAMQREGA